MKDWKATIRTWERIEKSGFGKKKAALTEESDDWQSEYSNRPYEVIDNTHDNKNDDDDSDLPEYLR